MTPDTLSALNAEISRSRLKYPPSLWRTLSYRQMMWALILEMVELARAMWCSDIDGNHGILAESIQVSNLGIRIHEEVRRRKNVDIR